VLAFGVAVSAEGSARPGEVLESLLGVALADRADLARVVLEGKTDEGADVPGRIDALHTAGRMAADGT
jgi:hypothetical protein